MNMIVDDTAPIPLYLLGQAMQLSRQLHEGNFPPTTGQIISAAKAICLASEPDRYTSSQGHKGSPRWFRKMKQVQFHRQRTIEAG